MFHPIGPQPPSVYWRRRLVVIGSVVLLLVLLVLTVNAVRSSGNETAAAGSPTSSSSSSRAPVRSSATSSTRETVSSTSSRPSSRSKASGSAKGSTSASSSAPPPAADCVTKSLQLRAATGKSTYTSTENLLLQLRVTNPASRPCVENLSDTQVIMRVYNGESRVWGSHDCKVTPGTIDRTLPSGVSVVVSIKWGGLTSQPGCKNGTRQRIGAGTYTLYATLGGVDAHATQFSIS